MVSGTSGSILVPWIQGWPHAYTFTLYNFSSGSKGASLASLGVLGTSTGTLSASPNQCSLNGGSQCTTNVSWATYGPSSAWVFVYDFYTWGNTWVPMVAGTSGSIPVPWIHGSPHQYYFIIKDTSDGVTYHDLSGNTFVGPVTAVP